MKIDKNTINYFKENNAEKIKIFFYNSGCSWTKLNIVSEFDIDESVEFFREEEGIKIYIEKIEKEKFENCNITRVSTIDHTWKEKIRYIFSSNKVKDRCGCGSSFSFSEKKLKLNLEELKNIKSKFGK